MRRSRTGCPAGVCLLLGLATLYGAGSTDAQSRRDTVIVPGPEYAAGTLQEQLLGDDYRDLWTVPLRVPFLDLGSYGGGLTVIARGGGAQTKSIRFRAANGRQYAFRSVNKWPDLSDEPALVNTLIGEGIQDQTSSLHPTAALVVPALVGAVGVPHVVPELVVMPDDPRLGELREEFAGMLGQIEERPEDIEDEGGPFPPFERVIGTVRLLERLEASADDRVDARTFLMARLLDVFLGDWDRHEDQWRWGELDREGYRLWVPIPRDRDYAFADYDGLLLQLGSSFVRNIVEFTPNVRNLSGLTLNARGLDRRILAGLDRAAWDSTVAAFQAGMTDAVIDAAVLRVPPEHRGRNPEIAANLKGRRDDIARAAADFYARLSSEVDVRGTDAEEMAVVDRVEEGVVVVRLFDLDEDDRPKARPYFERRFVETETNEIRVYLHGDEDVAVVRGGARETIMVRVVGGGGDDVMIDSATVRRGRAPTAFYDGRGDNTFVRGAATAVDRDDHSPPEPTRGLSGETYRDWGATLGMQPVVGYNGDDGPIVGAGPRYVRYGFWKEPYDYALAARGMIGVLSGQVGLELEGDVRNTASGGGYSFFLRGSELESVRFYGFGNDTEATEPNRFYRVRQRELLGEAAVRFGLGPGGSVAVGPIVRFTRVDPAPGTPYAALIGEDGDFGQAGAMARLEYDRRDVSAFPRNGGRIRLRAYSYPGLWDADPYTAAEGSATAYLTPSLGWEPTLALRVGGKKLWGDFPIHDAAFLGGARTLRGYPTERFAGEASAYATAELRSPLATVNLRLVRGTLGVHGLLDAGRVFVDGDSPGGWHTATGGGVWFRFMIREATFASSLTYARGDEAGRVYLDIGAPF